MQKDLLDKAILKTLVFYGLYDLPLDSEKIWQLLYGLSASKEAVKNRLNELELKGVIKRQHGLYSLQNWDQNLFEQNQKEIYKRWTKTRRYFWLLSVIPFIRHLAIINSLAINNVDSESDIDFFVITARNKLYFVRSIIFVLFRLLGVYKTRKKIHEQFCFGFYVTPRSLDLKSLMLEGEDPYFVFWLANMIPIFNQGYYEKLIEANQWIYKYFPNFYPKQRQKYLKKPGRVVRAIKFVLEALLYIPSLILEPLLRVIHIRHTFNLPENHLPTSTTIANKDMLKLHAKDPRIEIKLKYEKVLQSYS